MHTASERPLVQPEEDISGDLGRQDQIQVSVIPLQSPTMSTLESTPIVAGTGTWISQEPETFLYRIFAVLKKYLYKRYYAIIYVTMFFREIFQFATSEEFRSLEKEVECLL